VCWISFLFCSASVLFLLCTQNKHAKNEKVRNKTRREKMIPNISVCLYLTKIWNVDEYKKRNTEMMIDLNVCFDYLFCFFVLEI
jgi:hypothetical protein